LPETFFAQANHIYRRNETSCKQRCCKLVQVFRLQSTLLASLQDAAENDQAYLVVLKAIVKGEKDGDSNFGIEEELLLNKNRWHIAKDENLRQTIMEAEHDSRIARHLGT